MSSRVLQMYGSYNNAAGCKLNISIQVDDTLHVSRTEIYHDKSVGKPLYLYFNVHLCK